MKYLLAIIVTLAIIAAIVWGMDAWTQSSADLAAERGQAQALVIQAQGQSRLDSAQAYAITASANTAAIIGLGNAAIPWLVILCVALFALSANRYIDRHDRQPPRIIERQIIYLPAERFEIDSTVNQLTVLDKR